MSGRSRPGSRFDRVEGTGPFLRLSTISPDAWALVRNPLHMTKYTAGEDVVAGSIPRRPSGIPPGADSGTPVSRARPLMVGAFSSISSSRNTPGRAATRWHRSSSSQSHAIKRIGMQSIEPHRSDRTCGKHAKTNLPLIPTIHR